MFNHLLSDELKAKGIMTMTTEYAWRHADALEVLSYLSSKKCAVLGGDVIDNTFKYNYDNWYYSYNHSLSSEENIRESIVAAREYVESYFAKNGAGYYYILVATKNEDYILMNL